MIKLIKLYMAIFLIFNLLVIALFKLHIMSKTIFFYRGIVLIGAASVLTAATFIIIHFKNGRWRIESIVAATLISASLQLAFFVTVPVTLDRSVSVFLLGRIESHDQGVTKEQLTDEFISEYVTSHDAIGRRIYEQRASENIHVLDGIITISGRGRSFLRFAKVIKTLYGI